MDIKLIALDLDGTLLNGQKKISPRNLAALERAHRAGIWIVPSTGRFYRGMPDEVRTLPFVRYVIAINGAEVYDAETDRALYRAEIPPLLADRLYAYLDTLPVLYDCYQNGWGWMDSRHYAQIDDFLDNPRQLDMTKRLRTPVEHFRKTMLERNLPIQKSQMFFRREDLDRRAEELRRLPERFPELAVSSASDNNIEVNSQDAQKGLALRELCRALGLDTAQAMAFGDGLNDVSMLREAGLGVAMGNADPEVQAQADLVTGTNEEDGVAQAIERYVFGTAQ